MDYLSFRSDSMSPGQQNDCKRSSPMDEIPTCSISVSHLEKTITEIFVDGF